MKKEKGSIYTKGMALLKDRFCLKRGFLFVFCLALIIMRFHWPSVKVDTISIELLIIAALILFLPEAKAILPYVKIIKAAGIEIELKERLQKLDTEVEKVRDSITDTGADSTPQAIYSGIDDILREMSKDPRAALLLLASKLEELVRNRMKSAQLADNQRFQPLPRMVEECVKAGLFPREMLPAFRDFWDIRNRVAHGMAFDVSDSTIVSLISLGAELLKMASAVSRTDSQQSIKPETIFQ